MLISKEEQEFRDIGLTIPVPINLYILFTKAEGDLLNIIRQNKLFQKKYISDSLIRICTGYDKKTIKRAKDSLIKMGIINIVKVGQKGTMYNINYNVLSKNIKELNAVKSAYNRLKKADELRGKDREIHTKLIKEYEDSNFDDIF